MLGSFFSCVGILLHLRINAVLYGIQNNTLLCEAMPRGEGTVLPNSRNLIHVIRLASNTFCIEPDS